jgi:ATP-binding cassette subfamily B multidrug efflux pump
MKTIFLRKPSDNEVMKRLLRHLIPYWSHVVIVLIAIFLKTICDVVGPYLTKVAIDRYLTSTSSEAPAFWGWLSPEPLTGIAQIGGMYIGVLTVGFLLDFVQTYLTQRTGQKITAELRSQIFRHLQGMHIGFFDKNPVGLLVTYVTSDVDALNDVFTSGMVAIFGDILSLFCILIVMLKLNWKLALITFAAFPVIAFVTKIFRDTVQDSYGRLRRALALISSFLQEQISGMVILQLFSREKPAYNKFVEVNRAYADASTDGIVALALYYPIVELLFSVAISCLIWFGGQDVLRGVTTIGVLVAILQYAHRLLRPIQDLSDKYNILQSAIVAGHRVFGLLDTAPEITSPAEVKVPNGPGLIRFESVWFSYRTTDEKTDDPVAECPKPAKDQVADADWILRDVSLVIEPGERVAIVGHTGAGKTTLISLLLRFYDVQKGAITIDGVDIRQMDLRVLRRRFGVVLQDPFLFTDTVEGNIRLGTQSIEEEDVAKVAKDVNLADFICTLPGGLKEKMRERGSTLSAGQRQLLSLARALAHKREILVLDEATSSVDTETEFRLRDALARLAGGRTSLIVAHRLSTVQRCHKIIVMHKGQVRETGTHQELIALRGIYYMLYQLQNKDQNERLPESNPG